MIDLDRASLDRVLPSTPGPADWDDVMSRSGAQQRRHRLLVVLAVVALVAVGTASAFGVRAILLDQGSTALPPEGATPSTPETGEIVIHYSGRPGTGHPPVHQVWVYADGRMIWRDEAGPVGVADAAGEVRTGLLEQRLTPEGVELLRSELVSSGLFDRDRSLLDSREWFWGLMQARNGDRLVSVDWDGPPGSPGWLRGRPAPATPEQAGALLRLSKVLTDPASWLPASAWEARQIRAYLPSRYAICYWAPSEPTWAYGEYLEPARVVSLLPAAARALLRGKARAYEIWNGDNTALLEPGMCSEVTIEEARALAEIFTQAGFEPDPLPGGVQQGTWFNTRFRAPAPIDVLIAFEPILPHGQWEQMGG